MGFDHNTDLEALQSLIGYTFDSVELLERALTHRSFTNEVADISTNNQRMEFLGDSVVGLVVAQILFERFPEAEEGPLSGALSRLVCEVALAEVAKVIDLGAWVRLGIGEAKNGGRTRPSLLADAYEALIAAIYLDSGLDRTRAVIVRLQGVAIDAVKPVHSAVDSKSMLQKISQSAGNPPPEYEIVAETGPDHEKIFVAEARINGESLARGEGRSKKLAEQAAASEALKVYVPDSLSGS